MLSSFVYNKKCWKKVHYKSFQLALFLKSVKFSLKSPSQEVVVVVGVVIVLLKLAIEIYTLPQLNIGGKKRTQKFN